MYPDDIARAVLFHPSGKPSAAFFHFSVDCAEILFCYFAASYFFIYPPQSFRCLCRNYYSAGVAVDSVAKCRRKAPLLFRAVFAAPPRDKPLYGLSAFPLRPSQIGRSSLHLRCEQPFQASCQQEEIQNFRKGLRCPARFS